MDYDKKLEYFTLLFEYIKKNNLEELLDGLKYKYSYLNISDVKKEINKTFNNSLDFFWKVQTSQIYRELNYMEKSGWLTSKTVFQTDKPNKRLYSITDLGREELHKWLLENNFDSEFQIRSAFLMKIFFSAQKNIKENIEMFRAYKKKCVYELKNLEKANNNIEYYSKETEENNESIYWNLTVLYGEKHLKTSIEFADEAVKILEELL